MFTRRTTGFFNTQTGQVVNAPQGQQPLYTPIVETDNADGYRLVAVILSVLAACIFVWMIFSAVIDHLNYKGCDGVTLCNDLTRQKVDDQHEESILRHRENLGRMWLNSRERKAEREQFGALAAGAMEDETNIFLPGQRRTNVVGRPCGGCGSAPAVTTPCGTPTCGDGRRAVTSGGRASADGAGRCTMHGDGHEGVLGYEWPDRRCHERAYSGTRISY